jgi:hypothetical protein
MGINSHFTTGAVEVGAERGVSSSMSSGPRAAFTWTRTSAADDLAAPAALTPPAPPLKLVAASAVSTDDDGSGGGGDSGGGPPPVGGPPPGAVGGGGLEAAMAVEAAAAARVLHKGFFRGSSSESSPRGKNFQTLGQMVASQVPRGFGGLSGGMPNEANVLRVQRGGLLKGAGRGGCVLLLRPPLHGALGAAHPKFSAHASWQRCTSAQAEGEARPVLMGGGRRAFTASWVLECPVYVVEGAAPGRATRGFCQASDTDPRRLTFIATDPLLLESS